MRRPVGVALGLAGVLAERVVLEVGIAVVHFVIRVVARSLAEVRVHASGAYR
jgi:hypothetical protein